jgi:hypothetical protein
VLARRYFADTKYVGENLFISLLTEVKIYENENELTNRSNIRAFGFVSGGSGGVDRTSPAN